MRQRPRAWALLATGLAAGLLAPTLGTGCRETPVESPPGAAAASCPTPSAMAPAMPSNSGGAAPSTTADAAPAPPPDPVRLAFVGDIALNYGIADAIEAIAAGKKPKDVPVGFPFSEVSARLSAADLAIGNLECVASEKGTKDTWHKPFRAPIAGLPIVAGAGIDVVSVANNHSWDFGGAGFFDMLTNLDAHKIGVIGRGYRQKEAHVPEEPLVRDVRGTRVALVGLYLASDEEIARDVKKAREQGDLVVVYFHWGKEKQAEASPEQVRQGRAAIDAGADLVVGSHVHVLQPTEVYKGRLIAYGLGNFVFMGMNNEERFRRGAILEAAIAAGEKGARAALVSFEMIPTRVDDRGAPAIVVAESSYLPSDKAKKE